MKILVLAVGAFFIAKYIDKCIQRRQPYVSEEKYESITSKADRIIDHTFVINLPSRNDRWEAIQSAFVGSGLNLTKFTAINGKNLSDEYIKSVTTVKCNQLCSNSMIGIWLSHTAVWKHVVDNGLDNVLILEDDAKPVDGFKQKLRDYWTNVPREWDIIFLGCFECDAKSKGYRSNINENEHLFVPKSPAGLHGYMISNTGARKLLKEVRYVDYHIDIYMANHVFNNPQKDIRMYAFKPFLIQQNTDSISDNQGHTHQLLTNTIAALEPNTSQLPWSTSLNSQLWNIRIFDVPVTVITQIIAIIAIIISLLPFDKTRKTLLIALVAYELAELTLNKTQTKTKTKAIVMELLMIASIMYISGRFIRPFIECAIA